MTRLLSALLVLAAIYMIAWAAHDLFVAVKGARWYEFSDTPNDS